MDAFSIELANEVQKVRKTTLTLAPEAGSQRLRDVINKNVDTEQLLAAVEAAFKSGWMALKLYFMIGLPTETREDLDGILTLLDEVKRVGNQYSRRPVEIRASMACFVPKLTRRFSGNHRTVLLNWKKNCLDEKSKRKHIKLSFHDSQTSYLRSNCLGRPATWRGNPDCLAKGRPL